MINTLTKGGQMKKRVCAYARVSLDTETLEKSLSNQISYFNKLIQSNPEYEFVKIYYDDGISGTGTKKRAGFNQMINDAREGKIDLILTKSISRFARNTVDLLKVVRELKTLGVEIRFERENISTMSGNSELVLTILASFAQSEAESIGHNVRWAKRKGYELGKDQYRPTFGFDYENGEYKINEKEAKVVREVFKLFNEGLTYTEIAKVINKKGVLTRTGRKFNQLSIKDMLRQEKYIGASLLQKKYSVNPLTHKLVRNKGELPQYYVEGMTPAIVSKKDFEKAEERIKFIHDNQVKCHKQSSWVTGLVKCSVCGRSLIKINKDTLKCIGNCKYHNCDNREFLKIYNVEKLVDKTKLDKIDKIIYKKHRTTRFNKKGMMIGAKIIQPFSKGDFEIIWKK